MEIDQEKINSLKHDPRLFGFVYDKYVKEIYRYCYYLSRREHDAEDLTSETFMKALERIETFNGSASDLRAWLYAIARNTFLDKVRKEKKKPLDWIDGFEEKDIEDMASREDVKMMLEKLMSCINDLTPPEYAEILLLRYKQELEVDEIMKIVCKSSQNVRTTIHRATIKLKEICKKKK